MITGELTSRVDNIWESNLEVSLIEFSTKCFFVMLGVFCFAGAFSQWESEMSTLTGEESLERPKAKKKSVSKGLKKGRQLPSVTAVHKTQLREVGGEGEWWKVYGYFAGRLFKTNDEISIDQEI